MHSCLSGRSSCQQRRHGEHVRLFVPPRQRREFRVRPWILVMYRTFRTSLKGITRREYEIETRLHPHRAARRDRHHRHPGGDPFPGVRPGEGGGEGVELPEQRAPDRHRDDALRQRQRGRRPYHPRVRRPRRHLPACQAGKLTVGWMDLLAALREEAGAIFKDPADSSSAIVPVPASAVPARRTRPTPTATCTATPALEPRRSEPKLLRPQHEPRQQRSSTPPPSRRSSTPAPRSSCSTSLPTAVAASAAGLTNDVGV